MGGNNTNLLYVNVKDAYSAAALPPLGRSDHNLVYLQPAYITCVRRLPAIDRTFRRWTPEASESLKDCLERTIWSIVLGTQEDGSASDIVSSLLSKQQALDYQQHQGAPEQEETGL